MENKKAKLQLIKSKIEKFLRESGESGTLNESSEFNGKKFSKEELSKLIHSLSEKKPEDYQN